MLIDLSKLDWRCRSLLDKWFMEWVPFVPILLEGQLRFYEIYGRVSETIFNQSLERPLKRHRGESDSESGSIRDSESESDVPVRNVPLRFEVKLVYTSRHLKPFISYSLEVFIESGRVKCISHSPRGDVDPCSVVSMLEDMRETVDRRLQGPRGVTEIPTNGAQWYDLFKMWIFGPAGPRQTTLRKWLRPKPGR